MSLNLREFFKLEDINFSQEELELPYETTKHNEDNKPDVAQLGQSTRFGSEGS